MARLGWHVALGLALGLLALPDHGRAAKPSSHVQARKISVPFKPPIAGPVRYRSEIVEVKGEERSTLWNVSALMFARTGDGYRLTVTPEQTGFEHPDPLKRAVMTRASDLMSKPYVVKLSETGEIIGLENEVAFWNEIFVELERAIVAELPETGAGDTTSNPMKAAFDTMRNASSEARLAMLTEEIVPILEAGGLELAENEAIEGKAEAAFVFGGTIEQDFR